MMVEKVSLYNAINKNYRQVKMKSSQYHMDHSASMVCVTTELRLFLGFRHDPARCCGHPPVHTEEDQNLA